MRAKKGLDDLPGDLAGAVVALRADLNVPMRGAEVADDARIRRTMPTLRRLVAAGARVAVLSHRGRPGGRPASDLSLAPVASRLSAMLGAGPADDAVGRARSPELRFVPHAAGEPVAAAVARLRDGGVLVAENTRFLPGETANSRSLAEEWAAWADHFVTDAFGAAHRAHASTDALPRAVRAKGGEAVAGLLVQQELASLGPATGEPRRPFVAVVGGAKIGGKIALIDALLDRADAVLVGGAMAHAFFRALGLATGASLVEESAVGTAGRLVEKAGPKLVLPVDCRVAERVAPGARTRVAERTDVRGDEAIGDVGPVTAELFGRRLREAETVIWNGPMGAFETEGFGEGTEHVGQAAAAAAERGASVIVAGGDTAAAAKFAGVARRVTHVSTGGGAALEFLAGNPLPGLAALSDLGSFREVSA